MLNTSEQRRENALAAIRKSRVAIESSRSIEKRVVRPAVKAPEGPPVVKSEATDSLPAAQPVSSVEPALESDPAASPRSRIVSPVDGGEIEHLASALEALTAKYEMEVSAHRATTEKVIAQQQDHIESLKAQLRSNSL